jgi:small subunit ribosomal protein S4
MSRKIGPKHKLCRTIGSPLCGSPKCPALRRPYAPGEHGGKGRSKRSQYGTQLLEKQKLRYIYGVQERQFRRSYAEAVRARGITGEVLLQLLESRLDNLVYRLGFARTIAAARQLVVHGHVRVDGRRVDIPSCRIKPGQVIALSERARSIGAVQESLADRRPVPPYLALDAERMAGTFIRIPARAEIPVPVNEGLVVELYAR